MMCSLQIEDGVRPVALELIPTRISHLWRQDPHASPPYLSRVNVATGPDRDWVCGRLRRLSAAFGTGPLFETARGLRLALPA